MMLQFEAVVSSDGLPRLEVSSIKRAEGHEHIEEATALTKAAEKGSWQQQLSGQG
jgi:hypothetical protein